jgi:hypothetical protein
MNKLLSLNTWKILAVAFASVTPCLVSANQFSDSTSLAIKLLKRNSANIDISVELLSKEPKILNIPTQNSLIFGYEDDTAVDGFFEVYEIQGQKEIKQTPTEDYDQFNIKKELVELSNGKTATFHYMISELYSLDNYKTYKLRLFFRLSKYNHFRKDIYSNWIIIKVIK